MNRARPFMLLVGLFVAILFNGCFTFTPRLDTMADSLEDELGMESLDKEFGIKLGRVSTSLARGIAGWALDEDDEDGRAALSTMRGVRRVEVATYETRGDLLVDGPLDFERTLERRGWQTIARIREDDSFTWVVYKERKGSLRGFMVVALEEEALTLVDLRGKLDRTLAAAMELARDRDAIANLESSTEAPSRTGIATESISLPAP